MHSANEKIVFAPHYRLQDPCIDLVLQFTFIFLVAAHICFGLESHCSVSRMVPRGIGKYATGRLRFLTR